MGLGEPWLDFSLKWKKNKNIEVILMIEMESGQGVRSLG